MLTGVNVAREANHCVLGEQAIPRRSINSPPTLHFQYCAEVWREACLSQDMRVSLSS